MLKRIKKTNKEVIKDIKGLFNPKFFEVLIVLGTALIPYSIFMYLVVYFIEKQIVGGVILSLILLIASTTFTVVYMITLIDNCRNNAK